MDKPLFFLTIFLFAVGLIMIFSSSNVIAYMQNKASPSRYFMKQSIFLAISFIAAFILMQVKTKNYEPFSVIGIIGIIGMLIYGLI